MRAKPGRSLFIIVLVAGLAAITTIWSLESRPGPQRAAPEFGGAYVEGVVGSPARINPLFARENAADQTLVSLVFAGLTRLDDHGSPFPDMAQTWSISPDGLTYTFSLRSGLLWHDGAPVTANDVLFTYELLRAPELPIPPRLASLLRDVEVSAPDAFTVVLRLSEPYSPLPAYLNLGILPSHLLEGLSMDEVYNSFFNQQPIGSGPYRLERLTPLTADLVANPAYHLDPPFIQRIELRFYRDEGALRLALDRGEVTAALLTDGVSEAAMFDADRQQGLRFLPLDTGELTYVYLNLALPAFQQRNVRQALLYAVDREALILEALAGQAQRAQSPITPASWAYSPSLNRYSTDRTLAGLLLDEAGWRLDADGVRRRDGLALAFSLVTNNDPVRQLIARRLAEAWNGLGLQVTVSTVGVSQLVRQHIEPRDYEAMLWTPAPQADPDPFDQWHSSQATSGGANLAGLTSARVDALIEEARAAPQPRRKELYLQFQEIFAQEVPAIPLFVSPASFAQPQDLHGVRVGLLTEPGDRFWQVQEWFLKTRD